MGKILDQPADFIGDFLIETIPHSGTRFASAIFWYLGDVNYRVHHLNPDPPKEPLVLTTLRDPHLVAISNMHEHTTAGVSVEMLNRYYDMLIKRTREKPMIYLDIHCPEEKRLSHLVAVVKQTGVYCESHLPKLEAIAKEWRHVGGIEYKWKQDYLESGKLPDCIRRCDMERAVNWYNKAKQECVYDYIPPT